MLCSARLMWDKGQAWSRGSLCWACHNLHAWSFAYAVTLRQKQRGSPNIWPQRFILSGRCHPAISHKWLIECSRFNTHPNISLQTPYNSRLQLASDHCHEPWFLETRLKAFFYPPCLSGWVKLLEAVTNSRRPGNDVQQVFLYNILTRAKVVAAYIISHWSMTWRVPPAWWTNPAIGGNISQVS